VRSPGGVIVIALESVSKIYGEGTNRIAALSDVSLRVERGRFVSIMGPSGSGKSTLLNLLSALEPATSGEIRIAGLDIARLADDDLTIFRRRQIGLVFQFFNLLPTLSALDNTLLPVMLERRATSEDRERAQALMCSVGLEQRMHHRIHELSGGEMQRTAIARALMMRPALVLADEPTGNLDSATGAAILALLKETCVATHTTMVMVTHDRHAAEIGDQIVWLKDGRVVGEEHAGGGEIRPRSQVFASDASADAHEHS
jgi:putative ABC transport system ATP-binding protein